ncbi:MAG: ABC transporter ATP-binding protein [Patescibacteria group bacterium]
MQIHNIPRAPLRFALHVSKPFWPWALLTIAFGVIAGTMDTATYYVFKQLVDTAEAYTLGASVQSVMLFWVLIYAVTAVGHNFMWRVSGLSAMQWFTGSRKYSTDLLYRYLAEHSTPYFNNRFAGSIANKIANASGGVQGLYETIMWSYLNVAIAITGATYLILTVSQTLAGIFIGWIVLLLVANYFLSKRTTLYSERRAEVKSRVNGMVVDIITNMRAVKSFAQGQEEIARVEGGTEEIKRATILSWFYGDMLLVFNAVVMGLFAVSMIAGAWYLWSISMMSTGEFVMILTILNGIIGWFTHIGQSMRAFAERYGEVEEGLDEILVPHEIVDAEGAKDLTLEKGDVVFDNVTFKYTTQNVFEDFNLTIPAGQRVGIVGPSGAGKTSLVALLMRQHDVNVAGRITVSGQDIRDLTQDSLHEAIALVPQEPNLFHRSIRDNIAYGRPDATDEQVHEAARKAQAHEFIMALPDGYKTLVGERGIKLSGGQRQRVAIARAILKAAPFLILDEATSSLDSESEAEIQTALHELMQGKTVIAIAHRLSTIKEMDRIVVMDGGAITEDGTHAELVGIKDGLYARLWTHQAGGFLED